MKLPYRFGRYQLVEKIGQGGMAEVYRARYRGEGGFAKEVCVKRLLPIWSEQATFVRMLIEEAKALVELNHPNIVQVFELVRDAHTFCISMEMVEGLDLHRLMQELARGKEKLPIAYTLYILMEVLKGLRRAHQKEVIHRDISPQNILLSWEGEVKVADFGIAKRNSNSLETTHHPLRGKYAYMSPEQARGEKLTARSDLYSLGIVAYELLTGERLFGGENELMVLEQVKSGNIPTDSLQEIPNGMRLFLLKALAKEPSARFLDAAEMLRHLQGVMNEMGGNIDANDFASYLQRLFPQGLSGGQPGGEATVHRTIGFPLRLGGQHRVLWRGALFSFALPLLLLLQQQPLPVNASGGSGTLSITAKPWGIVTIPHHPEMETPLTGLELAAGIHSIQISYPPRQLALTQAVPIKPDGTAHCHADFVDIPKIICQ